VRLVEKIQLEQEGRQDQCAHDEDRHPGHNVESAKRQQRSAGQEGEKKLRDVRLAMLLEARCRLRFTKLEKRSPAMAKVEIRVPTSHPRPISAAQMEGRSTRHRIGCSQALFIEGTQISL